MRSIVGDLWRQIQFVATLFSERQANQTARVPGHEVDDFGSYFLSRANQVAFILAVFVVHDDDHAPFANVGGGVRNGSKWHFQSSDFKFLILDLGEVYVTAPGGDLATQEWA